MYKKIIYFLIIVLGFSFVAEGMISCYPIEIINYIKSTSSNFSNKTALDSMCRDMLKNMNLVVHPISKKLEMKIEDFNDVVNAFLLEDVDIVWDDFFLKKSVQEEEINRKEIEGFYCIACLDNELSGCIELPCSHLVHKECLLLWCSKIAFADRDKCPNQGCKQYVGDVIYNHMTKSKQYSSRYQALVLQFQEEKQKEDELWNRQNAELLQHQENELMRIADEQLAFLLQQEYDLEGFHEFSEAEQTQTSVYDVD